MNLSDFKVTELLCPQRTVCAQFTRDLFAIAKFLVLHQRVSLKGGAEWWVWKIVIFGQYLASWQWYKIEHSYYGTRTENRIPKLSNGTIFNDFERHLTQTSRSHPRNGTRYRRSYNGILIYTPYPRSSFRMTLSSLEWLSEILNDTKHRAVSLRQLNFSCYTIVVT